MAQCTWTGVADCPEELAESQSTVYQDVVYALGGWTGSLDAVSEGYAYDAGADSWSTLAPMLLPVTHSTMAIYNGQIWLVGGFVGDNPGYATDTVQIYDIATDTWSYGPNLPGARASGGGAFVGNKLYHFGGLLPDRMTDIDETLVLDLDDLAAGWQTLAPMPIGINHMGVASVEGIIYSVGGQNGLDGASEVLRDYMYSYDPATDSWATLASLPEERSQMEPGTFTVDGKIYAAGGRKPGNFHQDILEYDIATDAWSTLCTMPAKLHAPTVQFVNEMLVLANGGLFGPNNPKAETYTSPFTTTADYNLGVVDATLDAALMAGATADLETVLYTLREEADWTADLTGAPAWLTVNTLSGEAGTSGDEVNVTVDATGLSDGVYTYTLVLNAAGYTAASIVITLDVSGGTGGSPCDNPVTGLTAVVNSPTNVTFNWDPVPTATGYRIAGKPVAATGFGNAILPPTFTTLTANIFLPGTSYNWYVQARCADLVITPIPANDTFTTTTLRTENVIDLTEVAPNPASDVVTVSFNEAVDQLLIYNQMGQLVQTVAVAAQRYQVNVSELAEGTYVAQGIRAENTVQTQFVIQR